MVSDKRDITRVKELAPEAGMEKKLPEAGEVQSQVMVPITFKGRVVGLGIPGGY